MNPEIGTTLSDRYTLTERAAGGMGEVWAAVDTVVATALAHVNQPPPLLPVTIPLGVRDVIKAALAKDPADRPESAAAVAQALGMPGVALASDPDSPTIAATSTATAPTDEPGPAPTQVMPTLARAMPAQARLTQPPGSSGRRPRLRPGRILLSRLRSPHPCPNKPTPGKGNGKKKGK